MNNVSHNRLPTVLECSNPSHPSERAEAQKISPQEHDHHSHEETDAAYYSCPTHQGDDTVGAPSDNQMTSNVDFGSHHFDKAYPVGPLKKSGQCAGNRGL